MPPSPSDRSPRAHALLRLPGLWAAGAAVAAGCAPEPPAEEVVRREAVVLVTIDTFPADRVGCYGSPAVRTPWIDRLARTGILVRDAISPAPLTLPSHTTMLTGLDPPFHGVRDNGLFVLADSVETVAELLPPPVRKAAFLGAFPLHSRFGLNQGFDLYDDDFGERTDRRRPPERRAGDVFDSAADWLLGSDSRERPFAWAHAFDPHYPYEAPAPWKRVARTLPGADAYEGEVAFTDFELGRFLGRIGARDGSRRATILLTADHGEALGSHKELTHSIFIYDSTQRVPMILAGPGVTPRIETRQRRLVDVAPTLLALHGAEPPNDQDGDSLFDPPTVTEAYLESKESELLRGWSPLHALRTSEWKYVRAPRPELYDLVNDPGEKRNLVAERPEVAAPMAERVEGILAAGLPTVPLTMDAETAEKLHALGYIATIEPGSEPDLGKDPKDYIDSAVWLFHGAQSYIEGDLRQAEAQLRRSLQLDPEGKEAHSYLAGTFYSLGRFDMAAEYAKRALELPPHVNEGAIQGTLGQALYKLGRKRDALEHLREATRLRPGDPEYPELIARIESELP